MFQWDRGIKIKKIVPNFNNETLRLFDFPPKTSFAKTIALRNF